MATENLPQTFSDVLHNKAVRKAFYNVAAILFTTFVAGIAVAIYYILQPFLRPMLWALLCGSFLFPFKHSIAHNSKVWLNKMSSTNTPLVIGIIVLPFFLVNSLINAFKSSLFKHYQIFVGGVMFFIIIILFASLWPFDGLFRLGEGFFNSINSIPEYLNSYVIMTVVLGYIIVVVFFCNAKTKSYLQFISMAIWIIVIFCVASIKGPFAIFLGLVVTLLATGGSLIDIIRSRINTMAGTGRREPSPSALASRPENLVNDPCSILTSNQDGKVDLFSNQCLITLIWCIIILQLWIYGVLFSIGLLLSSWIAIQSLGHKFGIWSFLERWFTSRILKVKEKVQLEQRFYVIVPRPIRKLFKIMLEGDAKANQLLKSSIDSICSALIIILLISLVGLFAVFSALEVHKESMHLVRLTSNAFNATNHPELARWLPEGDVLQGTLDSMVKNAYVYGRESICRQLGDMMNGDDATKQDIEKQVLKLWDTLYNSWLNSNKSDSEKSISFKELGLSSGPFSLFSKKYSDVSFVTIAKENVDLFMSVVKSIWSVIVSNLAFTVKIITSILSIIFGGGTAIFNSVLSGVIFLTTLFYLLASSDDQYIPLKVVSSMSPAYFNSVHNFRVGKAFQDAIGSVFMVSCKIAMFYGLYTWFTHSLLDIQIVFIPSVVAAIFAAVPFLGTYMAAVPAVLELWLVEGRPYAAVLLVVAHYLPTFFIDTAFYCEMKCGHPYVTGLAIIGGMYWMGLEGAIIGPIFLCCFVVAVRMYQSLVQPEVFDQ